MMTENDRPDRPSAGAEAVKRRTESERRLAEALRDNLLKRKRQMRQRAAEDTSLP
jgi:hypothetical protein